MSEKIKILGVDDRPENLVSLDNILESLDIDFIKAYSGSEALEYLLKDEFALILMDVMMPDIDGYETASLIRKRKKTENIPIIFITAINTEEKHIFKGYSSGAVDYLSKPINPQILQSKVKIFIELYKQQQSLQKKADLLAKANSQISEQQKALYNSEVKFRTAFDQSFQFMAILNCEGKILELNKLAKELCGEHVSEIRGKYIWDVCWVGQDEENLRLQEVVKRAADGESVYDEASFTDFRGNVHSLLRVISPVRNQDSEIVYITMQGIDITERVQAEDENRGMEKILQQAQKMEALGTLAGGIAHDFNNILGVIIGNANIVEKACEKGSVQHECLEQIMTAGDKAKGLVKQILSFSRQSDIEKVLLKPGAVMEESIKLLRSSIPSTIEIVNEIDQQCGVVYADPTQLHQIVMNLCANAFHAMETKGGKLHLCLNQVKVEEDFPFNDPELKNGIYAQFTVRDEGQGISSKHLEKIFNPYFTTKEIGKGTGMGLAIVHGIVKSHGGVVKVETSIGKGTSFHIFLPLADQEYDNSEEEVDAISHGSGKVLLVDDELPLLEMSKQMLEIMGYTVTAVSDSYKALQLFLDSPGKFDLVITDQTMPGLTGLELSQKILSKNSDFPIILCTGFSPTITREVVQENGLKDLALKPVTLDEFSHVVKRAMNKE